jgi:photosystem II stability/assembly factor-like uncharacterized protein
VREVYLVPDIKSDGGTMAAMRRIFVAFSYLILVSWTPALGQSVSMQLITAEKGWALDNHRLFWTNDDGSHWKDITPPHQESETITDTFFLDSSHGWVLLCGEQDDGNKLNFHVANTSDSGETWSATSLKINGQAPDEFSGTGWINFADPQHGWLVLHRNSSSAFSLARLFATSDGGASWHELSSPPIAGRPVFATAQDGWVAGNGGPKGMYSTHDGGKNWQDEEPFLGNLPPSLPTNPRYGDAKFTDAKHGFLPIWLGPANDAEEPRGTAIALFTTSDGGQTWKLDRALTDGSRLSRLGSSSVVPDSSGVGAALVVRFNDREHLNRVTLMTIRPGEIKTTKAPSLSSENVLWRQGDDIEELSFIASAHGWARTSLGDLLLTADGGATWKNINPIPVVRPPVTPKANGPRVKARRLGPGPSLVPPSPQAGLHYTERLGFDQYSVALAPAMQIWWNSSPFFDVGFYVGGVSHKADPNLNSGWVSAVQGQGWGLMPLWSGPQAPCACWKIVNGQCVAFPHIFSTNAATAQAQGTAEANGPNGAVAAMSALGLSNTIIFYDMENYTAAAGSQCSLAVRAFLAGWVTGMTSAGFTVTGVYGGPGPAQRDFSAVSPAITQVWIAQYPATGNPPRVTIWGLGSGANALSDGQWTANQRAHQFLGRVSNVTYGNQTFGQIDYDVENLLIPGAEGTKPYIWTASVIDLPLSDPNYQGGFATGVNDVLSGSSPTFVNAGQVGQVVGMWFDEHACYICWYSFFDNDNNVGSPLPLSDPSGPNWVLTYGINDASQAVGNYCSYTYSKNGLLVPNCWYNTYYESAFLANVTTNAFAPINLATSGFTYLYGNNDDGQIVGNIYSNCNTGYNCTYTPNSHSVFQQ